MSDPRLAGVDPKHLRCPVMDCHMGPDANVYTALVRGPDGRQRLARGCVKHLELQVGKALSAIRLEPFE